MLSTAVSIAVVACALLISHAPAILSTRSALFIVSPRRFRSCSADTGRARAELGNLTASYCPPSAAKVNCENPRRKPVLHSLSPNWGHASGFPVLAGGFFLRPPQGKAFLHRMYTGRQGFRLARKPPQGAKSKERK